MSSLKQISTILKKSFSKQGYKKAIKLNDNESKTRDYLIKKFLIFLGITK